MHFLMLLVIVGVCGASSGETSRSRAPQNRSSAAEPIRYTGPGSCSSTSCHGSVGPRTDTRIWQNEYSIWIVKDKHSRAFAALSSPIAARMARILGLPQAGTSPKCLACHALDVPAADRGRTFDLSDGVSCESCHGPASAWLGPHTTRDWTHQQSITRGMYDTRDLVKRTEKCLSCHLGNQEKFVDHEMLAAGHPDLYFELDSFSAVMPRHWKDPLNNDPWQGVREWVSGQAVQLRESLKHLSSRASGKVWPEYAEFQCEACHHSLTKAEQSWRQERGYLSRRPGDPPWNASRYAVFRGLVRQVDPGTSEQLENRLTKLGELMSRANPDREAVASAATASVEISDRLVRRIAELSYDPALVLRLLHSICKDADYISGQGERAAEQAAMTLDSLFIAYSRNTKIENEVELRAAIQALFQQLQNHSGYDAPEFARKMRRVEEVLH
jgi:hypothetical protein